MRITILAALVALSSGCGLLSDPRTIPTIIDIGRAICERWGSENEAQLGGLSPADFCAIAANRAPFEEAAAAAKLAAGSETKARLAR